MDWKIDYMTFITVVDALLDTLEVYIDSNFLIEANVLVKDIYIIMVSFGYSGNDVNFPIEYKIATIALWDRFIALSDTIILKELGATLSPYKFTNPFGVN